MRFFYSSFLSSNVIERSLSISIWFVWYTMLRVVLLVRGYAVNRSLWSETVLSSPSVGDISRGSAIAWRQNALKLHLRFPESSVSWYHASTSLYLRKREAPPSISFGIREFSQTVITILIGRTTQKMTSICSKMHFRHFGSPCSIPLQIFDFTHLLQSDTWFLDQFLPWVEWQTKIG